MSKSSKYIRYKEFEKFLGNCDYFIWHGANENAQLIEGSGALEVHGDVNFFDDEIDFDVENLTPTDFWNSVNNDDQLRTKLNAILQTKIVEFVTGKYERVFHVSANDIESAAIETLNIIKNNTIGIVLNPTFIYKNCVAQPIFYNIANGDFAIHKYSSKTRKIDYAKLLWIYKILQQHVLRIGAPLIMLPAVKRYDAAFQLVYEITKYAYIHRTAMTLPKTSVYASKFSDDYYRMVRQSTQENFENRVLYEIGEFFGGDVITNVDAELSEMASGNNLKAKNFNVLHKKKDNLARLSIVNLFQSLEDFDSIIGKIEAAREIDDLDDFFARIFDFEAFLKGFNPLGFVIREYLKYKNFPWPNFSGHFLGLGKFKSYYALYERMYPKYRNKVENDEFYGFVKKAFFDKFNHLLTLETKVQEAIVKNYVNKTSEYCVWYDFEGFAMPFSYVKYYPPYHQVVFQCSIIKTNKNVETHCENLLYDPQTLKADDFVEIINKIHDPQASYYVVYNKSYELSRLKEMVEWLTAIKHKTNIEKLHAKVTEIIAKTVDLMELFSFRSQQPPIWIREFEGKYSIKLVEKYVTQNKQYLSDVRFIKEYKSLDVQNGTMAMNEAIKRALNITKERKWAQKVLALKEYCENDVRAMIMVADFARAISTGKFSKVK